MRYTIYIDDLTTGIVTVEAGSEDEACKKAMNEYKNGRVIWTDNELSISHIEKH